MAKMDSDEDQNLVTPKAAAKLDPLLSFKMCRIVCFYQIFASLDKEKCPWDIVRFGSSQICQLDLHMI